MFALNDQTTLSCRNKFLEYLGEVFGDLFECAFYRFIFTLVEDLDELAD
jgi:hypothetical protein